MNPAIENKNPFNLVCTSTAWQGKTGCSEGFVKFSSFAYGVRAGYINIRTWNKRGVNTLYKLMDVYSPADDGSNPMLKGNDPLKYAQHLAKVLNTGIHTVIKLDNISFFKKLGIEIMKFEAGAKGFPLIPTSEINAGFDAYLNYTGAGGAPVTLPAKTMGGGWLLPASLILILLANKPR